jgi:hypothetical protein
MRWRRVLLGALGLAALAATGLALWIGPRNVVGILRYDQRREGDLCVGDPAPDVALTGLDGSDVRLSALIGPRPLVLVFGSFT